MKIAVFRALHLGDMLCAIPACRALRQALPDAEITLIGLPWTREFAKRFPQYFNTCIPFPGFPGLPETKPAIEKIPSFITNMQQQNFDLVLQMHGSGVITNPLVHLFCAKKTAGYFIPGAYCPDEKTFFPYPAHEKEVRKWLHLVNVLGIPSHGEQLEFPLLQKPIVQFKNYICIHPGSRDEKRRWQSHYFAYIADALAALGYTIILTGTGEELSLTTGITKLMRAPAYNLAGKTDLDTLATLINHATLLIANDTGVSHLADALRTPSVIIFQTSDPVIWAPVDTVTHRVVTADKATVAHVLSEAEKILHRDVPSVLSFQENKSL